jgi:hypothetical protein
MHVSDVKYAFRQPSGLNAFGKTYQVITDHFQNHPCIVIPAKAGIQSYQRPIDFRFRRNDRREAFFQRFLLVMKDNYV